MSRRRWALVAIAALAAVVVVAVLWPHSDDDDGTRAPATNEGGFDADAAAERWTTLNDACDSDPAACSERDELARTIYNETTRAFLRGWLHRDRVTVESLTGDEMLAGEVGFGLDQLLRYVPDEDQFECVDGRSPVDLGCYIAVTTLDRQEIDLYLTFSLTAGRVTLDSWAPDV